jgi:hypothetical protein
MSALEGDTLRVPNHSLERTGDAARIGGIVV